MKPTERVAFFEVTLEAFFGRCKDQAHLSFGTGDEYQYVQFGVHDGVALGEVGSMQWSGLDRGLTAEAVEELAQMGFVGGGLNTNYSCDDLALVPWRLALLTDKLLRAAYQPEPDYNPVVRSFHLNTTQTVGRSEREFLTARAWCQRMYTGIELIEKKFESESRAFGVVGEAIAKSCLLSRLMYGGEQPSQTPCPVHEGEWRGIDFDWPVHSLEEAEAYLKEDATGQSASGGETSPEDERRLELLKAGCRCFLHKCGCTTGWQPDEHCGCLTGT